MNGPGGSFFPFLTPAEIYRQLTEGAGSAKLREEQAQTLDERSQEQDRAALVRSLANLIQTGWQGEASSGAYGAAMPLAERMLENAEKLDRSQDLLSRQIDSFTTAFHSVRPVGDPPELSLEEKFPFDVDHEKAVKEYQDAAQNNIVVFRAYDGASHHNETNIPQEYHTVDRSGGDVSVAGPVDTIAVGEPGPGTSGPGDVAGPGNSGYFGDGPHVSGPVVGGYPAGSGSPVGPGGAQTSPTEFRPSPTGSSPVSSYPSVGQSSPVSGGFGGVPFGGYSGGGPVGGFGPRGGGPGAGPGAGGGHGGGPGAGGRGPGLGAGVGALAAEEAARRAAQAAGTRAGGIGPMGAPVGTGRSKDDEDTEHQRKILLETDAEETFGSDVLTAPQVIGDDEYED